MMLMGYWVLVSQDTTLFHGIWIALSDRMVEPKLNSTFTNQKQTKLGLRHSEYYSDSNFLFCVGLYCVLERVKRSAFYSAPDRQLEGGSGCNGSDKIATIILTRTVRTVLSVEDNRKRAGCALGRVGLRPPVSTLASKPKRAGCSSCWPRGPSLQF